MENNHALLILLVKRRCHILQCRTVLWYNLLTLYFAAASFFCKADGNYILWSMAWPG